MAGTSSSPLASGVDRGQRVAMKAGLFLLLAGALQAGEIEGTVWYDSKGEVAWVEGPASEEKAREPWVPQWVAREARRDRELKGDYRRNGYRADGHAVWGGFYPVTRWRSCRFTPVYPRRCAAPTFRGIGVIIR